MKILLPPPPLIKHYGVLVARDDLIGGGTKARRKHDAIESVLLAT